MKVKDMAQPTRANRQDTENPCVVIKKYNVYYSARFGSV
jgi:hypothetical protein